MRSAFVLLLFTVSVLAGDADQDWTRLLALDAGPGIEPKSPTEAVQVSLSHIEKQESGLRAFLKDHPDDKRAFHARLRLARLLGIRSDLKEQIEPEEVETLLEEAKEAAKTPQQRADYDFARVGQKLRRFQGKRPTAESREIVLSTVRAFQQSHPKDPRVAALLVEAANLFEGAVRTKEPLLREANRLTADPELKAQIADDLKRLAFLGDSLDLRFTGLDGRKHDIRNLRGKPVILLFFAAASEPARTAFMELRDALAPFGDRVGFVGVSLDGQREELDRFLQEQKAALPVLWDGKGWNGAIAQRLGINAVPSAWLLDQQGVVRSLDAIDDPAAMIRRLE